MAEINRLNARLVATLTKPGRYVDGQGLHLRITDRQRTWVFMFAFEGKQREISLGPVAKVSLAEARRKAEVARRKVADGVHPGAEKKQEATKSTPTFGEVADEFLASLSPSWKNEKHKAQWHMTLGRARSTDGELLRSGYCLTLADLPVDQIAVDHVLNELRPIWSVKAETASRIRGRIEAVLDAAKARGLRSGENPAAWRGNLALLLPKRQKSRTVQHHAAMDYHEVPAFVARLRKSRSAGALAMEFLILCASRSGEVRGATWREIDIEKRLWIVPAARMKAGREHRVPLTDRAMAILDQADLIRDVLPGADPCDAFVFPGQKRGSQLSDMTLTAALRRWDLGDVTVHGFRSSFRDWAGDCTNHARELIEQALAHTLTGVEAAYRRRDALEKRRVLMTDWATYIEPKPELVPSEIEPKDAGTAPNGARTGSSA